MDCFHHVAFDQLEHQQTLLVCYSGYDCCIIFVVIVDCLFLWSCIHDDCHYGLFVAIIITLIIIIITPSELGVIREFELSRPL